MPRITGIGGVFLKSPDPKRLASWYAEHLGLPIGKFGFAKLPWTDQVPPGTGLTTWTAFPEDTKYFGQGTQPAMINYRVDDLDGLLAQLEAAGVWIDPKRDDSPFGKFAWIQDCDGNRLELWQPPPAEG